MKTAHIAGRSIQLVAGFKHLDELSEKLKPFSYRVLKEGLSRFYLIKFI